MHPLLRWGLPALAVVTIGLSLLLLSQRGPGTVGPAAVPDNWELALATELQDRDWSTPPDEAAWNRLRQRLEAASSQTQNPAVQALLTRMLEVSADRATLAGAARRDLLLGLALDIVARRDGVVTMRAQPAGPGASLINVMTSSRLPHVWEGPGANLDLQAVPRYPRVPVRAYGPGQCSVVLVDSVTGARSGDSSRSATAPVPATASAAIAPTSGPSATPIELSATVSGEANLRVLAWSPQLNRGVWLEPEGNSRFAGNYTLPALPPGDVTWRFQAIVEDCLAGPATTATYTIR